MIKIWPYKLASSGAKALATELEVKRIKSRGVYRPRAGHVIVNWGNADTPNWPYSPGVTMLNFPAAVNVAGNKLTALSAMQQAGASVPLFDVTKDGIIEQMGGFKPVITRYKLRGTSGEGAVYYETEEEFYAADVAPLYVEYVKKTLEYRVHVFAGNVIDFAVKRKRTGADAYAKIRNLQNGWVFCRNGEELPEQVAAQAILAVQACGLDFGAVDVISNMRRGVFVLEVNTAPGLEGTTIKSYADAIRGLAQ